MDRGLHSTDYEVHSPAAHGATSYALAAADAGAPAGGSTVPLPLRAPGARGRAVRADVSKDNRSSAAAADKAVASVMSEGQGQKHNKVSHVTAEGRLIGGGADSDSDPVR